MQVAGCQLALPCPAQQWHQCDSECIFVTLEIHLTTLFSEIFCFGDFFCDGTGRDVTNGRTDIGTDRLFLENIILDEEQYKKLRQRGRRGCQKHHKKSDILYVCPPCIGLSASREAITAFVNEAPFKTDSR